MTPRVSRTLWLGLFVCWLATNATGLEWEALTGHRRAKVTIPPAARTGFTEMPPAVTSIRFTNLLAEERSLTNQVLLNGSGVAAGDVDGDGRADLYFCGLDVPNRLYRNLGDWRFEDITGTAGVACAGQASTGAVFADVDGDGDLDLLVNGIARGTRLFLNDGHGHFQETTDAAGLRNESGSVSMALADTDGDGWLDLYVVNYRNDTMRDMPDIRFKMGVTNGQYHLLSVNGQPASAPEFAGRFSFDQAAGVMENGEPDTLYRNLGQGKFKAVAWTNGTFRNERNEPVLPPYDWGLSAMFRDLNGDQAPDLYVCNDFQSPDRVWINDGKGGFQAIARTAIRQTSLFSMGVDFADVDRDGLDDFFVADMLSRDHQRRQTQVMDASAFAQARSIADDRPQTSRNTLFHNRGDGSYAEIALLAGIEASEWSWCPAFLDVDLDGYEDLLITTGHWRDAQNADVTRELDELKQGRRLSATEQLRARKRFPRLDTPNIAFHNRGDSTFEETGRDWGFDSRRVSNGMALADLDNDGDLDVVINCLNDAPLLYRNESERARVAVRLRGLAPNTSGVGARIIARTPGLPDQAQEMMCGGRYLSSDDFMRVFAAGTATNQVSIEVLWRSGRRSLMTNSPVNHILEINEPEAANAAKDQPATVSSPWFADVSMRLDHQHVDEPFDDFARQRLLPRKLSTPGPGVTWFDFDGDGWDDLFIGTGRGGKPGVFRNDRQGGFIPQRASVFAGASDRDLTTILGWRPNSTNLILLLGLDNYENPSTNAPAVRSLSLLTGQVNEDLLRSPASTGPLAMADIDGDGDLDLFIGSRVVAGRYPEPASSTLLRNQVGRWEADANAGQLLANIGSVNAAVFTDLDGDGWPELVLACEWGPIRVLHNRAGKFAPWNAPLKWAGGKAATRPDSLDRLTGWWNSLAVGDFDNDGRMDLVAGNWGRNGARQAFLREPARLYFGDADGSGNLALLEAHHDPGLNQYVPVRDRTVLGASFPSLLGHYPTFASFSAASIKQLLAAGLPPMREVNATTFDSLVLLNRGDHFEARPLPVAGQFSPVFGIGVGDLDGDGNEDLLLAQNFFGVSPAESRLDAGQGLCLRGDGQGNFSALPAKESGINVPGEGRGVALADFDHDGRLDAVIGQNGGQTKVYRNLRARPGLRLRLTGGPENPQAVGAWVREVTQGGQTGRAQEVHLGGGYWSQAGAEIILGAAGPLAAVNIRWPNGVQETVAVPPETKVLSRQQPGTDGRR